MKSVLITVILLSLTVVSYSQFSGEGAGTEASPYLVANATHLNEVRNFLANPNIHFRQTADIDLGVAPWNQDTGWNPIGTTLFNGFQGNYDGAGFLVKNLTIRGNQFNRGLFAFVSSGIIKNLGLIDVDISGHTNVGGLAANLDNAARIDNCFVTGTLSCGDLNGGYVGGLVGITDGQTTRISNSYSTANVTLTRSQMGQIQNPFVGGIVGYNPHGIVQNCYAIGFVFYQGPSNRQGAVIGNSINAVGLSNLYWNRETTGQEVGVGRIEGFPGNTTEQMIQQETFEGFDFDDVWSISEGGSYPWLQWQERAMPHNIPGPLNLRATGGNRLVNLAWQPPVGTANPTGYNVYRDHRRINEEPVNITQYQDTGLTNGVNYTYTVTALFDQVESMHSNTAVGTPVATIFAGGDGTVEDPWQVATAEHLNRVRDFLGPVHNNKHFIQTADINLGTAPWNQGAGWIPIGFDRNNSFQGNFNGSEYIITDMTINRPASDYQALFGYTENAEIKNVGLKDVTIIGRNYVGGLIARIEDRTTVERCYVTGTIRGEDSVGGIVGYIMGDFEVQEPVTYIRDCYTNVTVTAPRTSYLIPPYAGGITARKASNSAHLIRNFAAGAVYTFFESDNVGAVIGRGSGGQGDLQHNYWNNEVTAQRRGGGAGTVHIPGNNTLELMRRETFTGFDFNNVWRIDEGESTPYLQWEGEQAGEHNLPPLLPPVRLSAAGSDRQINLSWNAPNEEVGIPDGYHVYRNGTRITDNFVVNVNYQDRGLTNWTNYTYYVTAVYNNVESIPSAFIREAPVLFAGGTGAPDDPFLVNRPEHLNGIRFRLTSQFVQTADIDLAMYNNWSSIGNRHDGAFRGEYDGRGFEISGLRMTSSSLYEGFFGYLSNAVIENVALIGVNLSGLSGQTGALAGYAHSSRILNCYVTGSVSTTANRSGGFIGVAAQNTIVENCWSDLEFSSSSRIGEVGGFIGTVLGSSIIRNSYSRGSVTATSVDALHVGGFAGWIGSGLIINCYSRSSMTTPVEAMMIGGFIGSSNATGQIENCYAAAEMNVGLVHAGGFIGLNNGTVTNCYWDQELSGMNESAGGQGRRTREMTYPSTVNTYRDWDFEIIWRNDTTSLVNNGYPYLYYHPIVPGSNPDTAVNPLPQNRSSNVSVGLTALNWEYIENEVFATPAGFRVYFNETGDFNEQDDYVWVGYLQNQRLYSTGEILPESLAYFTTYHWKVVPTTVNPDRSGRERRTESEGQRAESSEQRGDAENVPVWAFTTEINPSPDRAQNPQPQDEAVTVSVHLEHLAWSYYESPNFTNPAGFRVYLNLTGQFEEDDDFVWISYISNQENYSLNLYEQDIMPVPLQTDTKYFWKVVPTTEEFRVEGLGLRERHQTAKSSNRQSVIPSNRFRRGDADNVPVWQFTTLMTNIEEENKYLPLTKLIGNYPNPFNPETTIDFSVKEETDVTLLIYNLKGQIVRTLYQGVIKEGSHRYVWDGKDDLETEVSSGVYFYRLKTDHFDRTKKMLLVK